MKLLLTDVRFAFVTVWVPEPFRDDPTSKPAYSIRALLLPDDPQVDAINNAIDEAAKEKWGEKWKVIVDALRATDKTCLHNGDLKANLEGHAGNYYLQARSLTKPLVLDRDKRQLTPADGKPYGGCYGNLSCDIYVTEKGGKKACCNLRGVQFVSDGDAFAAGPPATPEEFDDLGVDNSALA